MPVYTPDSANKNQPQSTPQNELICSLIEAIGKHAVEEKEAELRRFEQRLHGEAEILRGSSQDQQAKVTVSSVIQMMAEHNDAVKADYRLRTSELGRALRMMVETIGDVSTSSQAAVHQLGVIEKNLEDVTAGPDAMRLRSKLEVCLKMIREQSSILRTQSETQVNHLKSFVASAAPGLSSAPEFEEPLDSLTGLPMRRFAENFLDERQTRGTDCLVGVVTVDRYQNLVNNFGQATADHLVKRVANDLAQRLPEATALCRWSAHTFIAITDIVSSYSETAQQWRRVRGLKVETQIEDKTRTALVILNTSLMVEHFRPVSSKRALLQNVERFAAQHRVAQSP